MKRSFFLIASLFTLVSFFSFSQISNSGLFIIKESTTVYFGNEYTNTSTGTHSNDGELYLNSNFINNGITSSNSGTTYFNSTVNNEITLSGTTGIVNFYNLELNISSGATKGLSVTDDTGVIVKNKVNLISGDLRLIGKSQLVQTHSGLNSNILSSGKLLIDQQGVSSVFAFNYWSAPTTNNLGAFSLNGGIFDGTDSNFNRYSPKPVLFNSGWPYNGIPSVLDAGGNVITALYINDNWLYTYAPNLLDYSGWEKITNNSNLSPGIGFSMKGTGAVNQNYVFKGIPNNGSYSFAVNAGESVLLGNPYPSALDTFKFIADNSAVIDKVHFWIDGGSTSHNLSNYLGGYAIYNLTGGVGPSIIPTISGTGSSSGIVPKQFMAVGQGFFIDAIGTGTITFDNSQRVFQKEDAFNSNFYKGNNSKPLVTKNLEETNSFLRVGFENPELFHRQLLLGFLPNSGADSKYNIGYDASMLDPRADEMYYLIENDYTKKYVIQGVGEFNENQEFPIGLTIQKDGVYKIMLDGCENFSQQVYIKDYQLNTIHDITTSALSITLKSGSYLDRFSIVFNQNSLNKEDVVNDQNFSVYFHGDNIVIINDKKLEINELAVYNLQGQQLINLNHNQLKKQNNYIPFSHQKGLYIIVINAENVKNIFKIIN